MFCKQFVLFIIIFIALFSSGCFTSKPTSTLAKDNKLLKVIPMENEKIEGNDILKIVKVHNTKYAVVQSFRKWFSILFKKKDFTAVSDYVSSLLKKKSERACYDLRLFYDFMAIPKESEGKDILMPVLDEWCNKEPECHIPWLLKGKLQINLAWQARGSGLAKDVKADAWPVFRKGLETAQDLLEKAQKLKPQDPNSSSALIILAYGRSQKREVMEKHFALGIKYHPEDLQLHLNKHTYLSPRWGGGTVAERNKFTKECFNKFDKYPYLGVVKVVNWREPDFGDLSDILAVDDVWLVVKRVYEKILNLYPDDLRSRFYYNWYAYLAKKYEIAYNQFKIIGNRWLSSPAGWTTLPIFHKYRGRTCFLYGSKIEKSISGKRLNNSRYKTLQKALALFEEALNINPEGRVYYALAIGQWNAAKFKEDLALLKTAHENLMEAVRLMPDAKYAANHLQQMRRTFKTKLGLREAWMSDYVK